MVELKSPAEIEHMRVAGHFIAEILAELRVLARVGVNLLELEEHVRQRIRVVGDRVEIEAYGAWNMPGQELGFGVALLRRQIEGAVDRDEIGTAELRGEPVGGDDPAA